MLLSWLCESHPIVIERTDSKRKQKQETTKVFVIDQNYNHSWKWSEHMALISRFNAKYFCFLVKRRVHVLGEQTRRQKPYNCETKKKFFFGFDLVLFVNRKLSSASSFTSFPAEQVKW